MGPEKHSRRYAPSKSSIWLNCPLSTLLNDGSSNEQSEASLFGTQCHELGAALISKSLNIVDYEKEEEPIEEIIKRLDMYTPEMQELADSYANYATNAVDFEKRRTGSAPLVVVEQFVEMPFDEDAGGTLDFGMISSYNGGTLTIIDLKTGRLPVLAFNKDTGRFNTQLGLYALYFYKEYKDIYPVKNVRLVIYQPVISNVNDYEMPIDNLLEFERCVVMPAVERSNEESPEAISGAYCKYCSAKAICGQRSKDNSSVIADTGKKVEMLTDDEIEELLPKLDELIQYATDVKDFALKKAMNGHRWKGFKLVHAKTQRKIGNEEAVIKVLKENGYDPYANQKVASITELTKRIGKKKFNELVNPYVTIQEGSISLVPESDIREEAKIETKGNNEI